MREEWIEVKGGRPALKLWPESAGERALQTVERALLEATLEVAATRDQELHSQVEQAVCACRDFTGYGMFLHFVLPPDVQASQSLARTVGGATLTWRDSASSPLAAVAFLKAGVLELLEIYPSDGESWTVDACRAITAAALDAVDVRADVDRDTHGPE
jgi:hypothetical protein